MAVEERSRILSSAEQVLTVAEQVKGRQLSGVLVSFAGCLLVLGLVATEGPVRDLTTTEFVAALIIGATMAVAGPFAVAYSTSRAHKTAVEVEVANRKVMTAEANERQAEELRKKAELELELKRLNRESDVGFEGSA